MTKTNVRFGGKLAILALGLAAVGSWAQGSAIVYDNTTHWQNNIFYDNREFGDEVNMIGISGGVYKITEFSFEYFVSPTLIPASTKTLVLRLYALDGPTTSIPFGRTAATPGTELFDSSDYFTIPLTIGQNGYNRIDIGGLDINASDRMAWTVQFSGLAPNEQGGLLIYNPPTVGTSFNDFWRNNGGTWTLSQIDGGAVFANFGARVLAIPEPTSLQLLALAGLGTLGWWAIRRRAA
ncbi:MAG: PEP-CTERM sorting domain-containing protein [Verrucomicrobia bacterium]|nr:PEP-CTERM sorting domain-containing protein [Verrucomicrobiota bacterium]